MTTGRIDQITKYAMQRVWIQSSFETTFHTSPYLSCVHSHLAVLTITALVLTSFNHSSTTINTNYHTTMKSLQTTVTSSTINYEQWNQYYQQESVTHSHLHTTPSLTSYQGHHSQPTHHGNQVTSIVNSS